MPIRLLTFLAAAALAALTTTVHAQDAEVAGLIKKLNSTFDVAAGANGLGKLGGKAKTALPDLGKALKKARFQSERVAIAASMEKVISGMRAQIPDLKAQLKAGTTAKEHGALSRRLAEISALSKGAADDLGDMLLENKANFMDDRLAVTKAIAACGSDAAGKGVKGLAAALKGGFAQTRLAAANALGQLGPVARAAIPALTEASRTGFIDDRKAVSEALKKIQK